MARIPAPLYRTAGRLVLRAAIAHPGVEIVAVNDPFVDAGKWTGHGRCFVVRAAGWLAAACAVNLPLHLAQQACCHPCLLQSTWLTCSSMPCCTGHFQCQFSLHTPYTFHPVPIAEYMAYMLKYDSVHGRFPHDIHGDGDGLWIDGKKIAVHAKL